MGRLRHIAYAGGWKKCEPLWDLVIRAKRTCNLAPAVEAVLGSFGRRNQEPIPRDSESGERRRVKTPVGFISQSGSGGVLPQSARVVRAQRSR